MRRWHLALAVAIVPSALLLAACSKDTSTTVQLYARVPPAAVPDRTAAVSALPKDGQYWATDASVQDGQLVFSIARAFFGPTCTSELGADKCPDDVGTDSTATGRVTVAPAQLAVVTVLAANGQNYAIDGTELARLVDGDAPSAKAPTGFRYTTGPYLVTMSDGVVTAANEVG